MPGKIICTGSATKIISGSKSGINDHFLKTTGTDTLMLINKKIFELVVTAHCTGCPALAESVMTNKVTYEEIEKL